MPITTSWSEPKAGRMDITPLDGLVSRVPGPRHRRRADHAQSVLAKARFWETFAATPLNERQRKVVNRLLDGFEGKLTTSKYAKLTECSQDTALRDILSLVDRGILIRGESRGPQYQLRACCAKSGSLTTRVPGRCLPRC